MTHFVASLLHVGHLSFSFLCRVALVSLLVFVVLWLALDTAQRGPRQMVSFLGLVLLIFLMLLFSKHPFKVGHVPSLSPSLSLPYTNTHWSIPSGWCLQWSWRVLVSGILIQFIIALLIFRTSTGDSALKWAANKVEVQPWHTWTAGLVFPFVSFFHSFVSSLSSPASNWRCPQTDSLRLRRCWVEVCIWREIHRPPGCLQGTVHASHI